MFVDHASGKIFNFPQYSTNASETVQSTQRLALIAGNDGITIKSFHADNGIFAKSEFKNYCECNRIKFYFCGVGAKHQNGVAERNIKTVTQWARANMLHLAVHWPLYASSTYWPQAIDYAVWVFNCMPNMTTGISSNKLWSSVRGDSDTQLSRGYVFGCPVYVLDAALQDGKKIPKWNPHACLGLFLGFLDVHSSQVLLVLNVEMGKISPQFHVIFDNKFATVHSLPRDQPLAAQWENIFCLGRKCFLEVDYDDDNNPILPPPTDIIKLYAHARTNQQASQTTTPFLPINHEVGSPIGDSEGDLANNSSNQEVIFPIGDSAGELVNTIPQQFSTSC